MNRTTKASVLLSEPHKYKHMKKLVTYITVIASAFVLSTNAAEAKPHQTHPAHKAKPVHASSNYTTTYQKVFSHYDRHGHAIYTYRKVIVKKNNSHHNHQPQHTHRAPIHTPKAKYHRR